MISNGSAHAEPCVPAVVLVGDALVIAPVTDALRERGLEAPMQGCPSETAHIETRNGMFVVSILDADGRETSRRVADPATAAALIESFSAQLLPHTVPLASHVLDSEQPRILVVSTTNTRPRGAIAILEETTLASDGSVWSGIGARACAQLGLVCVGGQARIATDLLVSGDGEKAETERRGGDLQLFAEWPIEREGWCLTPAFGIGIGWLHMRRDVMTDVVEVDEGELRTSVRITAELPLTRSMRLTVGATLDVSPTAHAQPFLVETRSAPGEPVIYSGVQVGLSMVQR